MQGARGILERTRRAGARIKTATMLAVAGTLAAITPAEAQEPQIDISVSIARTIAGTAISGFDNYMEVTEGQSVWVILRAWTRTNTRPTSEFSIRMVQGSGTATANDHEWVITNKYRFRTDGWRRRNGKFTEAKATQLLITADGIAEFWESLRLVADGAPSHVHMTYGPQIYLIDNDPDPILSATCGENWEGEPVPATVRIDRPAGFPINGTLLPYYAGDALSITDYPFVQTEWQLPAGEQETSAVYPTNDDEGTAAVVEETEWFGLLVSGSTVVPDIPDIPGRGQQDAPDFDGDPEKVVPLQIECTILDNDADPTEPISFVAAPDDSAVELTWKEPVDKGGNHDIDKFQYRFAHNDASPASVDATWNDIENSGTGEANNASWMVSGLTNDITHRFELRAVNSNGKTSPGVESSATPRGSAGVDLSTENAAVSNITQGRSGTGLRINTDTNDSHEILTHGYRYAAVFGTGGERQPVRGAERGHRLLCRRGQEFEHAGYGRHHRRDLGRMGWHGRKRAAWPDRGAVRAEGAGERRTDVQVRRKRGAAIVNEVRDSHQPSDSHGHDREARANVVQLGR